MKFLQRQRIRALKHVAYRRGDNGQARVIPTPRWQFDLRTSIIVAVTICAFTALSVWGAIAQPLPTPTESRAGQFATQTHNAADTTGNTDNEQSRPAGDTGTDDTSTVGTSADPPHSPPHGRGTKRTTPTRNPSNTNETPTNAPTIIAHVAGAVTHPGIVTLARGARVFNAIDAAGGAKENAQLNAINLAAPVHDGEYLYIPTAEETHPPHYDTPPTLNPTTTEKPSPHTPNLTTPCLDINHATPTELQQLPGVGPALAERIVEYREHNGFFGRVEDLDSVSGIGQKLIHRIRDAVCN